MTNFGDVRSLIHAAKYDRCALRACLRDYEGDPQEVLGYIKALPFEEWPVTWRHYDDVAPCLRRIYLDDNEAEIEDLQGALLIGDYEEELYYSADAARDLARAVFDVRIRLFNALWPVDGLYIAWSDPDPHQTRRARNAVQDVLHAHRLYVMHGTHRDTILDAVHAFERIGGLGSLLEHLPPQEYNPLWDAHYPICHTILAREALSDAREAARKHKLIAPWTEDDFYIETKLLHMGKQRREAKP